MSALLDHLFSSPPDEQLVGPNVFLRPPRDSDWKEWAELREVSRDFLVPWEPTWPKDALTRSAYRRRLRHYAEQWRNGSGYSFFVVRRSDAVLLGGLTLSNVRRGITQSGSLGYWIGEPYARKGVMTEAVRSALCFCFDNLTLHRVEAACLPNNIPSRRLLDKCGFREEGYATKYLKIDGEWADHVLFAKLREEAMKLVPGPADGGREVGEAAEF
ncbi:MAG: GNAT family protein [Alphaproteobacteria bacterium]|nr:GNAT family protein [Alphaproteobacteria bacterium]